MKFTNWAKTFSSNPHAILQPSNESEIIQILHDARSSGRNVRVVGAGHSPSDIACIDGGVMLNLDKLNRLIDIDKHAMTVTVEAGMRLTELHRHLENAGFAVSNLGSISEQSIAGAISTGTHGTGFEFGILASMVLKIRIVLASGEILECTESLNGDLFKAALCSLGCLGVITQVTLKVEKSFYLHAQQFTLEFSQLIDQWEQLVVSGEHVRFWWIPHTDTVIMWRGNRYRSAATPSTPPSSSLASWLKDRLFGYNTLEFLLFIAKFFPQLVPFINQTYLRYQYDLRATSMTPDGPLCSEVINKSVQVFNFDCLFKQYVTEWAVEWRKAGKQALIDLYRLINHSQSPYKAHFPVEIRFVKNDDIWLSPAYGNDPVCYIGIIAYRPYGLDPHNSSSAYWNEYENIMRKYNGRPHWAKDHPMQSQYLASVYPKYMDFCRLRQKLDPSGVFVNNYIRRHLAFPNDEQHKSKL